MSKKEEICTCGCDEYGCICDGDCECDCDNNPKNVALKVGLGIATIAIIGGVIAAIVCKKK